MSFSARIKHLRESKKMSEDQLAQASGIDAERLGRLESDTEPTVSEAAQLAEALDMRMEELFSKKSQTQDSAPDETADHDSSSEDGPKSFFAGVKNDPAKAAPSAAAKPKPEPSTDAKNQEPPSTKTSHMHTSLDRLIQKLVRKPDQQRAYLEQTAKLAIPTSMSEALHFHEITLGVLVSLCNVMEERTSADDGKSSVAPTKESDAQSLGNRARSESAFPATEFEEMQRSVKLLARCLGDDFPNLDDADKERLRALRK